MPPHFESQVLVVGAGPVGLTLAMDLAQRGIDVVVAESRERGEPPSVKCNHVSARSMEIFRRLGVAAALRDAGLPPDHPNDVAYRTTFAGPELARIHIPCRQDRYSDKSGPDGWWPTPEPPHRINQIYLEPILFAHAEAMPKLRIANRVRIDRVEQGKDHVIAYATDLDCGEEVQFRCAYLVGCDGGRSTIRKAIGAKMVGDAVVGRVQSTYLRASDLLQRAAHGAAWATFSLNPRRSGNVYAIDGKETFLLHNYLRADETDFDAVDRDWAIRTILGVGEDFRYDIISKEDWVARRLVADRFRDRRLFICGDAAHLWVPMAGYGMNAGIADAANLSWLLAGRLQGWAGEAALSAYEAERQPITDQVSHFAMQHALALQKEREAVPATIEDPGPDGEAARSAAGAALYALNVRQYCCAGLNFGYFYDRSPLIAYDDETPPPYSMDSFTPSTVPGCRTPHLWLGNGRSLYDVLGPGYTLLCSGGQADTARLEAAAAQRNVPLSVFQIPAAVPTGVYRHAFVLVRPDQHVAWRGGQLPRDPLSLIDKLRGAAA